ncbi:Actin-binding FH2 [Artemisia annua]|uniref:Actin-binding FH2 n=1 Tax=Artemisia annua TaxID=35608 RepID=A0A2U1MJ58_ARTAN|nr:Actin-binding FH2 [Artemisia annua]
MKLPARTPRQFGASKRSRSQFISPTGEFFKKAQNGPANGAFTPSGSQFISPAGEYFEKAQNGRATGAFNHSLLKGKINGREWLSNMRATGISRSNMNFTPGTYTDYSLFNQNPLPYAPSRTNATYPYMNATDLENSWGKPNGSFTNKVAHNTLKFWYISFNESEQLLTSEVLVFLELHGLGPGFDQTCSTQV